MFWRKQNNKNTGDVGGVKRKKKGRILSSAHARIQEEQKAAKISRASKQRFGLVLSCRLVTIKRFE